MIRQAIRRAALMIPQLRRLVESRDAALAARDIAMSGQRAAEAALTASVETALASGTQNLSDLFRRFLNASAPDTWLQLELNGTMLWLPRDTLLTMFHCIHPRAGGEFYLSVEQHHLDWMIQHLMDGGTFLDVGAATGATALPIAARFGNAVRIICYEPAEAARKLLLATLARNKFAAVQGTCPRCLGRWRHRRVSRVLARRDRGDTLLAGGVHPDRQGYF